jgi:hypothetical protein
MGTELLIIFARRTRPSAITTEIRMSSSLSSPPLMLPASLTTFDPDQRITVGEYLAHRLLALRVDHVFGVPGDYSLGLCDQLINTGMRWVGCCSELNAGYAADAYARVRGLSAVCVTYGVGAFSLLNVSRWRARRLSTLIPRATLPDRACAVLEATCPHGARIPSNVPRPSRRPAPARTLRTSRWS